MGLIGGFVVILIVIAVAITLLKYFAKNLPLLIGAGILIWLMFFYTKTFFLYFGIGLGLLVVLGVYFHFSQLWRIRRECIPLLEERNSIALAERFFCYDKSERKTFLGEFVNKLESYSVNRNDFLDELFLGDFWEFAKSKRSENQGQIVFEKKDCDSYLAETWNIRINSNFEAIKNLISAQTSIVIHEQKILDEKKKPITLIIIKFEDNTNGVGAINMNGDGVIDLDD